MHEDNEQDELLSTEQARILCKVTAQRMRDLAGDGRVPAVMKRHAWWFSRRELEDILARNPKILYNRRTPEVVVSVAMRESRRAAMLRINALRSKEDRHKTAQAGFAGLLAKFARQIDPNGTMDETEREAGVQRLYRAHMAEARSRRASARQLTTTEQRVAALQAEDQEIELKARRRAGQHAAPASLESLTICFDCWRASYGRMRVPAGLTNKLCDEHQRDADDFAAALRAALRAAS